MSKITFLSQVRSEAAISSLCVTFVLQFTPNDDSIKSILDYKINFAALDPPDTHYMAIGKKIISI